MCKFNPRNGNRRIDPCMKNFIERLNELFRMKTVDFKILACCCGHKKYHMTVVCSFQDVNLGEIIVDFISGQCIPRKKKFYKKDKQGVYYIPEAEKAYVSRSQKTGRESK